ncbi:MAG: MFS transporter, partial [Planctomycetota bacterium]
GVRGKGPWGLMVPSPAPRQATSTHPRIPLRTQKFYTDTFGLSLSAAAWILLVGRMWDAMFDPLMGAIADRTDTRWGKFRPWVLWTALPWGVAMYLAYSTPDLSTTGKIVYACVTNIALMTLYSANNTPYSAMTGVLTADGHERTVLSSYRFFSALVAQLIVGGFTLPLVAKFGQGNDAKGWQMTMGLWAAICVVLFVITFLTTRERIRPDPRQQSSPREDFAALLRNGPWIAMFALTVSHFIVLAMRGGTMAYYFDYYVDRQQLYDFLKSVGLPTAGEATSAGAVGNLLQTFGLVINADRSNVSGVGFSLLTMSSQFVMVLGVMASAALSLRFGKRAVAIAGFLLTTIFMGMFAFMPPDAIWGTFALEWIRALAYGPTVPLLWAMFADVADYGEWKTGRRTTGVVFATILFALKAGLSLGSALSLWLLDAYGYRPNAEQTPEALRGIRLIISVYPALFFGVCIACLACYRISRSMNQQIQTELAERRRSYLPG